MVEARLAAFRKINYGEDCEVSPKDQALVTELVRGVWRETAFLNLLISEKAKKPPRAKVANLLKMALYQLLFLDRIPEYAIFSTVKDVAAAENIATQEVSFIHGVLKAVSPERDSLAQWHHEVLQQAREGVPPKGPRAMSLLNLPGPVVDEIAASARELTGNKTLTWKVLSAMKTPLPLVGYALNGVPQLEWTTSLGSEAAPRALRFESAEAMRSLISKDKAFVQGEASQWACERASAEIAKLAQRSKSVSVLEMTAGKGGKTLGTLTNLKADAPDVFAHVQWQACDAQMSQVNTFEHDVAPRLSDANLSSFVWDWSREEKPDVAAANDFVWLDAPCSGVGTLAKHPEIALRISAEAIKEVAALQSEMLKKSVELVRPGGLLFYTVCTITHSETLAQMAAFQRDNPGFELIEKTMLWPQQAPMKTQEGFFGVLLKKAT